MSCCFAVCSTETCHDSITQNQGLCPSPTFPSCADMAHNESTASPPVCRGSKDGTAKHWQTERQTDRRPSGPRTLHKAPQIRRTCKTGPVNPTALWTVMTVSVSTYLQWLKRDNVQNSVHTCQETSSSNHMVYCVCPIAWLFYRFSLNNVAVAFWKISIMPPHLYIKRMCLCLICFSVNSPHRVPQDDRWHCPGTPRPSPRTCWGPLICKDNLIQQMKK